MKPPVALAVDCSAGPSGSVAALGSAPLPWGPIRLRRDGSRPLCFSGCLIARHDGWVARAKLWHDLALYRTEPAGYAVEIVARLSIATEVANSRPARCYADLFETLDDALTQLEGHDASGDICPGLTAPAASFDDPAISPVSLAIQMALLQGFRADVVNRYAIGVGSFLRRICLAGI